MKTGRRAHRRSWWRTPGSVNLLLRSALQYWPEIAQRVRAAPSVALFLDFDGTLAEVKPHPGEVWLDARMQRVLSRLARHPRIHTCVISGRRKADLELRAGVPGLAYVGLHGWDRGSGVLLSAESLARLQKLHCALESLTAATGAWVEDKGATIAVHYRRVSALESQRLQTLLHHYIRPPFRLLHGDKVWEVFPPEVEGKGVAAARRCKILGPEVLPIYLGNDGGDELAFRTLARGITIRVGGSGPTRARFSLAGPPEARQLLELLLRET